MCPPAQPIIQKKPTFNRLRFRGIPESFEKTARERYDEDVQKVKEILAHMKSLLKLAVTNVHFKCNGFWYVQSAGLAMGASLAVILANVWMKSFEASLQKPELIENNSRSDQNGKCNECKRRVIFRGRGVESESCKNWFHARCQKISNEEDTNKQDNVWICTYCNNQQIKGRYEEMKLFKGMWMILSARFLVTRTSI